MPLREPCAVHREVNCEDRCLQTRTTGVGDCSECRLGTETGTGHGWIWGYRAWRRGKRRTWGLMARADDRGGDSAGG